MFKDYYNQQLDLLNETAKEFAHSAPGLAGLLRDIPNDPDTRRLLQGFAFLTANVQRELDGQFPRLLHSLTQVMAPHYLKPNPCATIMSFEPKPNLLQPVEVSAHAEVESDSSQQRPLRFRTSRKITVNPLSVVNAEELSDEANTDSESKSVRREIQLDLSLNGVKLNAFNLNNLEFFIDDKFTSAANLFYFLNYYLEEIYVVVNGQRVKRLSAKCLQAGGFGAQDQLYPSDSIDLPIFNAVADYFGFVEKYLFFNIDLSEWQNRPEVGEFSLIFSAREPDFSLPEIHKNQFRLHCVPAINLFSCTAEPILVDYSKEEMLLTPASGVTQTTPRYIYAVDQVTNMRRGNNNDIVEYHPINKYNIDDDKLSRYSLYLKPAINRSGYEVYLTLATSNNDVSDEKAVLKTAITCYNGEHAEQLDPGTLTKAIGDTPELVSFTNLYAPSMCCEPSLDDDRLWRVLSDIALNQSSLHSLETLQALLRNYIPRDERNESNYQQNVRNIDSITSIDVKQKERLFGQSLLRGSQIKLVVKSQEFSSPGAYYLFGSVIDRLFAAIAPLNTFSELEFKDFYSGESIVWPARLGSRTLI